MTSSMAMYLEMFPVFDPISHGCNYSSSVNHCPILVGIGREGRKPVLILLVPRFPNACVHRPDQCCLYPCQVLGKPSIRFVLEEHGHLDPWKEPLLWHTDAKQFGLVMVEYGTQGPTLAHEASANVGLRHHVLALFLSA